MRQRILVTGGAGFVGSHLVDSLLRDGFPVTVFDSLARPGGKINLGWLRERHAGHGLTFIQGDVRDSGDVQAVVTGSM